MPIGLVKIRLWRPFPFDDIRKALAGVDLAIVCDRIPVLGAAAGPVLSELRSAMYPLATKPQIPRLYHRVGGPGCAAGGF